jgi:hypothetical protein
MEIRLNDDEWSLMKWLHDNAKGYAQKHHLPSGKGGFLEATKMLPERYEKAAAFLQHFHLIETESVKKDAQTEIGVVWLTPDGENSYRVHEKERSAKRFSGG